MGMPVHTEHSTAQHSTGQHRTRVEEAPQGNKIVDRRVLAHSHRATQQVMGSA
jgi:hypothetical protein